jgi:hypothetical protein
MKEEMSVRSQVELIFSHGDTEHTEITTSLIFKKDEKEVIESFVISVPP